MADVVASLSTTGLDRSADGEPTAREVIHHLADAELVGGLRLRRILTEDYPHLPYAAEDTRPGSSHSSRSIETSASAFQGAVLANVALLESLRDDDWLRAGHHAHQGRFTVEDWLRDMSEHAQHHAEQVLRAARQL